MILCYQQRSTLPLVVSNLACLAIQNVTSHQRLEATHNTNTMNILGSITYTLNVQWQKKIYFLDQKHDQEDK
jgi:hypothetical protein